MAGHDDLKMQGEVSLFIHASPDVLYEMVSDVTRMGDWSPETFAGRWIGKDGPVVGARFKGDNRSERSPEPWRMVATVTVADPGREFAFVTGKVEGPATHWRYRFEPERSGTRVTESFEWTWKPSPAGFRAQVGAAPLEVAEQMVEERRRYLLAGMTQTLENLKRVAEAQE